MSENEWAALTLPGSTPEAMALKHELSEIIMWNERNAPRSQQKAIGPSELGDPCDRKIAYKIAGIPPINIHSDPWPAIVGTSIHDWLEGAMNLYQQSVADRGWMTELRVYPDPMVRGRSDVYNHNTGTIVDWKSAGSDTMRKVRKGEIPEGYKTQIQIYGLGHKRAGRDVRNVALVFLPRCGWLDDMEIWHAPYDESVAVRALGRMYAIGDKLIALDIEQNPHRFTDIDPTPGDSCVWCPFYNRSKDIDAVADLTGCPGR